jgi:23S rRNA (cytosine1962-C5)-methyltransferase
VKRPYRLIDFGEGRKLESLGDYVIERPAPPAEGFAPRQRPWPPADAVYRRRGGAKGDWIFRTPWPELSPVDCGAFMLRARPTPFGHLGLFPEQRENWRWIERVVGECDRCRVLNLFAYTGGSTLAAAAGGAEVTHVDAARPNVEAAKENARLSGFAEAPIRYLTDDARKLVPREIRRQRSYNLVILDPPAYGHAARGSAWRLPRDLWPLLDQCVRLLSRGGWILLTGHSPDVGPRQVRRWLRGLGIGGGMESGRLEIEAASGRRLDAGFYCRIQREAVA